MTPHERELERLVLGDSWLLGVLEAARDCALPDWLVGAGVIRDLVWDHLHGYRERTPARDVDLVFFDPHDVSPERDRRAEDALRTSRPDVAWDATNQAAVHLWYEQRFGVPAEPLTSSADGVGTWPETATSVAVRLNEDDSLDIVAPCGLDDLFAMVLRRNPRRVTPQIFQRRLVEMRILERWPNVRVVG